MKKEMNNNGKRTMNIEYKTKNTKNRTKNIENNEEL